jgi:type IV secretion system protein VirB1
MDLLTLAMLCGPLVDPSTTLRVISVESAGHPYVIHDDSNGKTYDAATARGAAGVAGILIRAGHRIDVGLMQINYEVWLKPTHVSIETALAPCTNIRLGTTILSANYARALTRSGTSGEALFRALSQYNSGSDSASWDYAERVLTGRTSITLLRRGF